MTTQTLLTAMLAGALTLTPAWADPTGGTKHTGTGGGAPAMDVSAGAIAESPERYVGKAVRVRAEVEDVYGEQAFTLDEDEAFAGPDVLVLIPNGVTEELDDTKVTVRGPVREFTRAGFERDYDWFDGDGVGDADLDDFESRPVIVASSVRTADGKELITSPGQTGAPATKPHSPTPRQKPASGTSPTR